jgi:DNA polymerase-3 subunit alpha
MNFSEYSQYDSPYPAGLRLPKIKIEDKYYRQLGLDINTSNFDFLKALCRKGVKEMGLDKKENKQEYYDRTLFELNLIRELSFTDYMLLNWEVLNFCKENGVPTGAGRGSAASSLVLFLIGVTKIDPIKYELYFERFISKARARKFEVDGIEYLDGSLAPDVDNDISYDRRAEVIEYINNKYKGRACKILTLNTLSSKLCIKECGKIVDELSESQVNEISDSIPKKFGKVAKLAAAFEESEIFKKYANQYPLSYDIAKKLEGLNKNTGVHPSGICISYYDVEDIMPLQKTSDGSLISGYDMNDVASLSVKFDILGLRTLSVVHAVCEQLGIKADEIDVKDPTIYAALACLEQPQGLFQIEADTNFKVCKLIRPRNLEELSAVVAIARPGALDFKDRYADYVRTGDFQSVHPFFDDVLSYTGGIPLYQEQLMKMAVKVGFSLDESEQLRRIVGKKKVDQMVAWKDKISQKISENNLDPVIGEILWKVAEDSANYSFNKSHSISYANLAAITIYLKFNYPQEFFLNLMKFAQFEPDPLQEIHKISQELSFFDIELLPPDLNKSDIDFKIEGKNIRYGLNCIKGVSSRSLEALLEFREESFSNKYEAFLAAKQSSLNIGCLSSLIQAGLLDSLLDKDRCRLVLEAQTFNVLSDREKRNVIEFGKEYNYDLLECLYQCQKQSLLGDDGKAIFSAKRFETFKSKYDPYKKIYEMNKKHMKFANWFFESELLGYSYSYNVRQIFKDHESSGFYSAQQIKELEMNKPIKFVGTISDIMKKTSASGNKYARIEMQDELGSACGLFMDSGNRAKLTEYLDSGKKLPIKGDIIIVFGSKGDDIIFVDKIEVLQEKIYMKLSQLK